MGNPVVCGNFRKLQGGGGEELDCNSQPAEVAAHRLRSGLVRKAPVEKWITEFSIMYSNFGWEGGGHTVDWRPIV